MKKITILLAALFAALLLAGCSSAGVEGKWKIYQNPNDVVAAGEDAANGLDAALESGLNSAVLEFRDDGKVYLLTEDSEIFLNTYVVDGKDVFIYADGEQVAHMTLENGTLTEGGETALERA